MLVTALLVQFSIWQHRDINLDAEVNTLSPRAEKYVCDGLYISTRVNKTIHPSVKTLVRGNSHSVCGTLHADGLDNLSVLGTDQ